MSALATLVPPAWRAPLAPVLHSPSFHALDAFLLAEEEASRVFPPRAQIFAALDGVRPEGVKAVILGQDPYPTAGNANGLCFSVSPGVPIPASLKNLFAALVADVGIAPPSSGDLSPWVKQGVLLLNTVLTVREGAPLSHRNKGWEVVSRAVLELVNRQAGPVVFLCFGKPADKMVRALVDPSRHVILTAPHPSPLNGKRFVLDVAEHHQFARTNELLVAAGRQPIDWALP